jgi:hypothetical protein
VPPRRSVYGLFRPIGPDAPLTEALERSRGPLLELPAQGPWAEAASTYRSIFHRRPLLNGYSGYWPVGYAERMALARRLPDPAAVRELEGTTGLRQIVVHTAAYRPEERRVWIELANRGGDATLALVARDGPDLLFDVVGGADSTQGLIGQPERCACVSTGISRGWTDRLRGALSRCTHRHRSCTRRDVPLLVIRCRLRVAVAHVAEGLQALEHPG